MVEVNEKNACEVARTVKGGAVVGQHSVRRSPSVTKIAAALCVAQTELKNPVKNKQNPHLKNWYADLTAVLEAVLPVFTKHKLSVMQLPCELDDAPAMMTLVMHESGEWIETVVKVRPVKSDPQGIGSAQTYAKRYALQSIAGIAAEDDDDGHAATHRPAPAAQQQPKDNLQLRARVVTSYAQAQVEADVKAIDQRVAEDKAAGMFSPADLDAIRQTRSETKARLAGIAA